MSYSSTMDSKLSLFLILIFHCCFIIKGADRDQDLLKELLTLSDAIDEELQELSTASNQNITLDTAQPESNGADQDVLHELLQLSNSIGAELEDLSVTSNGSPTLDSVQSGSAESNMYNFVVSPTKSTNKLGSVLEGELDSDSDSESDSEINGPVLLDTSFEDGSHCDEEDFNPQHFFTVNANSGITVRPYKGK